MVILELPVCMLGMLLACITEIKGESRPLTPEQGNSIDLMGDSTNWMQVGTGQTVSRTTDIWKTHIDHCRGLSGSPVPR